MNRAIILVVVFALGAAAVGGLLYKKAREQAPTAGSAPAATAKGLAAPAFELTDLDGKVWRLADLKGKVVFVNFWATWCQSCQEENPSLQALMNAEKGNDKFVLLMVLTDDDPAKARDYLKQHKFDFTVLLGTRDVVGAYGLTGVPETFIIDKKGVLREKAVGPMEWNTPDVRGLIAKLAAE